MRRKDDTGPPVRDRASGDTRSPDAEVVGRDGHPAGTPFTATDGHHPEPATEADGRVVHLFDPPEFSVLVHPDGNGDVIAVAGEIDLATAPQLHTALQRLLADGHTHLIVDLSAVTFMDCSVLTFLVTALEATSAAGGSLRTTGDNPLLARLLDASELSSVLPLT